MGIATNAPPGAQPDGFADCYHTHYGRLTAQLTAYLADPAAAEDVVQEAFLRAWQRWRQIRDYEDPVAWIRRVAWNLATSRWRRIVRDARLARQHDRNEAVTAALGPDNVALMTALRRLPPNHRRVIVLHYLADLPVADIVQDLGVPRGTVLSWLHRGRAELAGHLRDDDRGVNR
ncbi:RNA polymerase sigma factor [Allorhizocola rhizosphaerae]|uniref:RNA polymerase sigma factor n=1 Tax=Allorhizocola rhizosphaerae TaxID=1872709 RepID=UPI000E3BB76E|nr:SigE family RNA polymerase sigma factor [Allorhizocola rhizosphaerae]